MRIYLATKEFNEVENNKNMDNEEITLPFSPLIREKFKDTDVYKTLYGVPNPMATHKKKRAIKNRNKNRGVKHGRRKS